MKNIDRNSAGFQLAVSRISNSQSQRQMPTRSRRYDRLETCATSPCFRPNALCAGRFGILLGLLSLFCLTLLSQAAPRHVYLTWQGDTSTTITVNYQTLEDATNSDIYYDTQPRIGDIPHYRFHATGTRHKIPGLADGRTIHWVELTRLKPGNTYFFVAGDPQNGFTAERKFRTIPDGHQDLRFAIGGDMGTGPAMRLLVEQAGKQEPNFAAVGGDIAYANDLPSSYKLWDAWLDAWEQYMITPKGFTVPMVLAIGNHEVRGGVGRSLTNAIFYFRYFAQEHEHSYYSRKFGKSFVMYLLDSGHLTPHDGEQSAWLEREMEADTNFTYRFAVYHVPLYPAYRAYEASPSATGRNTWLPVFDKHHLTAGFEHHDHVFVRTKLLRNNQPDPQGTLYLGDGCWGQGARNVSKELRWYEEKAASLQHFWLVDVSRKRVEYRAINKEGKIFDVYPPDAKGAAAAEQVYQALIQSAPRTATTPQSKESGKDD
jgi:hypothetical protein